MPSGSSVSTTQVCGCVALVMVGGLTLVVVGSSFESPVAVYLTSAGLALAAVGLVMRYR